MESHQLYKKILFPTDLAQSSIGALKYTVELSIGLNADLIILHTFRLTDLHSEARELYEAKKKLENSLGNEFRSIEDQYLKSSGVHYLFLSEVGFISDRIISNVKEHDIDLLVLGCDIQQKMSEISEVDCCDIIPKVNCPILLIPRQIKN